MEMYTKEKMEKSQQHKAISFYVATLKLEASTKDVG